MTDIPKKTLNSNLDELKKTDFSDIPSAWTKEMFDEKPHGNSTVSDSKFEPKSGGLEPPKTAIRIEDNSFPISEPKPDSKVDPDRPFTDDILGCDIEPATDEEMHRSSRKRYEDMNEDFDRYAQSANQREQALRKRMFDLQQRLHSIDFTKKERFCYRINPFVKEVIDAMAEHLGEHKCTVIESAVLMFYRNCFSFEKGMLADLGLMLDSATLQNQELAIEASALEDLANLAMQAEASPLNQEPPEH